MGDIGEIAGAVRSVAEIVRPLVETAIAERYEKQHFNFGNEITHAFETSNPDDLWRVAYGLCQQAGHSPTPSGGTGTGGRLAISRELLHSLMLVASDAIRDRAYMVKYLDSLIKK